MKKILNIRLKKEVDEVSDYSDYGKYTDDLHEGVIVRQYGEYWENLTEEQQENIRCISHEYRGFLPYAGGEKVGTKEYYEYGKQDYNRMVAYNQNGWWYEYFYINADIEVNGVTQHIKSGGLSQIESDIPEKDMQGYISDECNMLRRILEELGFEKLELDNAFQQASLKW